MNREVSGVVTQVIPPEKHNYYNVPSYLKQGFTGKFLVAIDTNPDSNKINYLLRQAKNLVTPGRKPTNDFVRVVLDQEPDFNEGDFVELDLHPYVAKIPNHFQKTSKNMKTGEEQ